MESVSWDVDSGPGSRFRRVRRAMTDMPELSINELEREEYLQDFKSVAEDAKYPPFSVPTNDKENDFLLNLSREYDAFVTGEKPYDSFEGLQNEYADELVESRAWRSLGYSPEKAAKEAIRKSLEHEEYPDTVAEYLTSRQYETNAKVGQMFADEILPWGAT